MYRTCRIAPVVALLTLVTVVLIPRDLRATQHVDTACETRSASTHQYDDTISSYDALDCKSYVYDDSNRNNPTTRVEVFSSCSHNLAQSFTDKLLHALSFHSCTHEYRVRLHEYYYLSNRMGSVMGLLDAGDDERILEYYRYTVYGEATVLPIVDDGSGSGTAGDGIEDTPFDLSDNNTLMLAERASIAKFGRVSRFQNTYMYTGRRLDEKTGLHYYRYRYYEARMGRFVGRDSKGYIDGYNLYGYCGNSVMACIDPFGLSRLFGPKGAWGEIRERNKEFDKRLKDADEALELATLKALLWLFGEDNGAQRRMEIDPCGGLGALRKQLSKELARRLGKEGGEKLAKEMVEKIGKGQTDDAIKRADEVLNKQAGKEGAEKAADDVAEEKLERDLREEASSQPDKHKGGSTTAPDGSPNEMTEAADRIDEAAKQGAVARRQAQREGEDARGRIGTPTPGKTEKSKQRVKQWLDEQTDR